MPEVEVDEYGRYVCPACGRVYVSALAARSCLEMDEAGE